MRRIGVIVVGLACMLAAAPAAAQVAVGGQASLTGEGEPGIGPRVSIPLDILYRGLSAAASFDWFFADQGSRASGLGADVTYVELNGNVLYRFARARAGGVLPYAGGGLNMARRSFEYAGGAEPGSTTDTAVGLNLVGGVQFRPAGMTPFAELRLELGGGERYVLSAGILFGGAPAARARR